MSLDPSGSKRTSLPSRAFATTIEPPEAIAISALASSPAVPGGVIVRPPLPKPGSRRPVWAEANIGQASNMSATLAKSAAIRRRLCMDILISPDSERRTMISVLRLSVLRTAQPSSWTLCLFLRTDSSPPKEDLRFHDLRHTFGTRMIDKADIRRVQEWMGHADIQTTMKYLLHYAPREGDAALVAGAFPCRVTGAGRLSSAARNPRSASALRQWCGLHEPQPQVG